jgi:hypothetical protein
MFERMPDHLRLRFAAGSRAVGTTATLCLIFWPTIAPSAQVSGATAQQVAQNWIMRSRVFLDAAARLPAGNVFSVSKVVPMPLDASGRIMAWHAVLKPQGYIVLAADDRINPVICFSPDHDLDMAEHPRNALRFMLTRKLAAARDALAAPGLKDNRRVLSGGSAATAVAANQDHWVALAAPPPPAAQEGDGPAAKEMEIAISPLLGTFWSQWNHFNRLCPNDADAGPGYNGKAPAGCTPVAGAQVAKYYQWPPRGVEAHTDVDGNSSNLIWGAFWANFTSPFDWENMQAQYDPWNEAEPSNAVAAVAELIYKLGVAANIDYGSYAAGGSVSLLGDLERALTGNFLYERRRFMTRLNHEAEFDEAVRQDILAARPVIACVPGHSLVVDGYAEEDTANYCHINYGWGGINDGWYEMSDINGGSLDEAIIGLEPKNMPLLRPMAGPANTTGHISLSWDFPTVRRPEVTAFRALQAVFAPAPFMDTAADFSRWDNPAEAWSVTTPGNGGAGTCFHAPGGFGAFQMTLRNPIRPGAGAQLRFAYKAILADDEFRVLITTNRGQTWSEPALITATGWDPAWHSRVVDLAPYAGAETWIRFRYSFAGGLYYAENGAVWLDDVEITQAQALSWSVCDDALPANATNSQVQVYTNATYYFAVQAADGTNWGAASPPEAVVVALPAERIDSDADGLPDMWEEANFGHPTAADPGADPDGDSLNNRGEFGAGTCPTSAASRLDIASCEALTAANRIAWPSVEGRTYTLLRAPRLLPGAFSAIASGLAATPPVNVYEDADAAGPGPFFYRVAVATTP